MRFIGSKVNLLDNIKQVIDENCDGVNEIFCDIFSGTGAVSRYFKPYYQIISNDLLYFSYLLTASTIENNVAPQFNTLKKHGIDSLLPHKWICNGSIFSKRTSRQNVLN